MTTSRERRRDSTSSLGVEGAGNGKTQKKAACRSLDRRLQTYRKTRRELGELRVA